MKYFAFSQLDSEGRIISLSSGEEGSAGSLSVAEVAGGADDPDLVLTLQDAAEAVTAAEEADKKLASTATGITQVIRGKGRIGRAQPPFQPIQ